MEGVKTLEPIKIQIEYTPRKWAKEMHHTLRRWIVLVLHRRAGKTTAVINHFIKDAGRRKETDYAYIAPTYKQAKRIAWKMVKQYTRNIPGIKYNESELLVTFPNLSTISLFGSESIDSLRGIGLDGAALDENSQQPPGLFGEIISKCLADRKGYCIWLGTPKGKGSFYRTFNNAQANPDTFFSMLRTIDDNLRIEEGKVMENLKEALEDDKKLVEIGEMTIEEFEQEWYCSFEAAIRGAYYMKEIAKARKEGRIKMVPWDPAIPVHTVWDLGVGQNLTVGFYQASMDEYRMIDCEAGNVSDGILQMIKTVKEKEYIYGKHFAPHDVSATEESTGVTRWDFAAEQGIEFEIVPKLSVDNGINMGKLFWAKLFIDEKKCETFLDAMGLYKEHYDEKTGRFTGVPDHDWTSHYADLHRYAGIIKLLMTNEMGRELEASKIQANRDKRKQGHSLL